MGTDADFEAFLAKVKATYDHMAADPNNVGMRVTGRGGDIVIAFERYLKDLSRTEPEAEMGHVMDAVCSLLSTLAASFATIASDDRADEDIYKAYVVQVFTQAMRNIIDPDYSTLVTINITGQAN